MQEGDDEDKENLQSKNELRKRRLIERELVNQLREGCEILGIRFDEWDMDQYMCRGLKRALYAEKRTSNKLAKAVRLFEKYDVIYQLASDLDANIDNKYAWFHEMCKNVKL